MNRCRETERTTRYSILARQASLVLVGTANFYFVTSALLQFSLDGGTDWNIFELAASRISAGFDPYVELDHELHHAFRWSPIAAWLLVPITAMPFAAWVALHAATLALLRHLPLIVLVGASWPFMLDVVDGGIMIFVAVTGFWAVRGKGWASVAFLTMAILVPRPLMLPGALWILLKSPALRLPFIGALLLHGLAVAATGWHDEWIARLLSSGTDMANPFNLSPSRVVGAWWMVVGVPLGLVLFRRGRVGLASLAISPYILPPYLLILLLERSPFVPDLLLPGRPSPKGGEDP